MLTVACVLKSGGIYDATWVARLKAGVARHLPLAHRFVCLSDVDVPCERIPLQYKWPGWWAKIETFRLKGPVLYFDLDTAIVGDLTAVAIAAESRSFIALRDFYRLRDGIGSGVMAWSSVFPAAAHYEFTRHNAYWQDRLLSSGDQGFVEEYIAHGGIDRWQDVVDDQIVSYKIHCRNGIPPNARAVCLHGKPKFGDMPECDPVRLSWEMAA